MICAQRVLVAGAAVVGLLGACGDADPCAGAATCVELDLESADLKTIDQLELDVVYAGLHATTTTGTTGNSVDLPLAIPLTLDVPGSPLIQVNLIAAGKLGGSVLGLGAGSTSVQQGFHTSMFILLEPASPCTEGALSCGDTIGILGAGSTLYQCTDGVPIFYAPCSFSCSSISHPQAVCLGLGPCQDGGTYCGGHALDGDPRSLYVCQNREGTMPRQCPNGCLVLGDGHDACK